MSKEVKRAFAVVSVILIIQTILLIYLVKELNYLSSNEQSHYNYIISNMFNIESRVQAAVSDELSKTRLVKETHFNFDKSSDKGYTLNVSTELSRLGESSKVIFCYKEESANTWTETEMTNTGSLSYTCNIDIAPDKEYVHKIITKGSLSESSDILAINKDDYMPEQLSVIGSGNDQANLSITLGDLYNNPVKNFNIDKIEALVKVDGKETTYLFKKVILEGVDENNAKVDNINYEVYIPNKEIKGNLEYIKAKVTYDNGLIDIREITPEIDSYFLQQRLK